MYCLADDAAIKDVITGGLNLAAKVKPTTIAIDLSTIDPQTSDAQRMIYEKNGVAFLDAPIFGTKGEARDGGLWIVIGGDESVFKKSLPVLEPLSETTHYMGKGGNGAKMKLVGNLLVASQLLSIGEALSLAKNAGLDLRKVLEVAAVADFYDKKAVIACLELHTFSSLNKEFLRQYRKTLKLIKKKVVFVNEHTLKMKNMIPITREEIIQAFEDKDIHFVTSQEELLRVLGVLKGMKNVFLMMSSGNFDGVNFESLGVQLMESIDSSK
jgi:3-hydroxyisobutyrate dehydrogenase-like beta-hydroxyacid dehydrogenase